MRVVRCFLRGPWSLSFDMVDVERLSFRLDHPRWRGGIGEMMLVEVENSFVSCEDLRFVVHAGG